MNKKELIVEISQMSGLSKATSEKALSSALDAIADSLKKGSAVTLIGFGSFSLSKRNARNGRNPRTGETMRITEKMAIRFKAGKKLDDTVN